MKEFLSTHRRAVRATAMVLLAGAVFVLAWFQPQKLFIDETVDESLPGAAAEAEENEGALETPSPTGETPGNVQEKLRVLLAGSFQSLEHETSGEAKIVELPDGRRFLRFENLETSNGPDLRIYLSEIPASDDWFAYGQRFVDLGALKGNRGNQNYEIPSNLDLSRYESAVIWCRRFTVGFGVAGLS